MTAITVTGITVTNYGDSAPNYGDSAPNSWLAVTAHSIRNTLQPPPIHLPHLNPRQHILPEHPQIYAHPVEIPPRQRQPVGGAAAGGAVVAGEPVFVQVGADIGGDGARRGFDPHLRHREIAPERAQRGAQGAVAIIDIVRPAGQGDTHHAAMAGACDGGVGHWCGLQA